jgi:hypothetical protein
VRVWKTLEEKLMTVLDEFAAASMACKTPDAKGYSLEVI